MASFTQHRSKQQSSLPATKQDVDTAVQRSQRKLRKEIRLMKNEIIHEVMHQVKILNEQLVHDFRGAAFDKFSLYDDHLKRYDEEIATIKTYLKVV